MLLVAPNDDPRAAAAGGVLASRMVEELLATTALEAREVRLGMVFNQTETYPGQSPAAHPGELVTSQRGTVFTGDQLADWRLHTDNGPLWESGTDTYFEASTLALDGRNAGFPRPKALLVVVLFATREDCTIAKPELMFDDSLWPASFYYPHVRCTQPLPGMLRDPADYVDALLAAHEQRIFVAVVASREKPVLGTDKNTGYHIVLGRVHCGLLYLPSRRVATFADAITARQHERIVAGLLTYDEKTEPCVTTRAAELAAQIKAFAFSDAP